MSSIVFRLDRALDALKARGLAPVTILLGEADYGALALMDDWPVTRSVRGELRYRSIALFQARGGESGSLVGRGPDGSTHRIAFPEAGAPAAGEPPAASSPQPK